jgi:multiple sugar transport system permease protein
MAEIAGAPTGRLAGRSRVPAGLRRGLGWKAAAFAGRALILLVLVVFAAAFVFPLAWMLSTSLKAESEVFALPPIWIPAEIRWSNYPSALTYFPFPLYLRNTLIITLPSVLGNLISSALVAYGFSRVRWPGRDAVFTLVLATLLIPTWTTLIPVYVLFARMHWVGTFLPLIVPKFLATDAFFIFLMVQFIRGIPREIDEAARIDGAGHARIFFHVILPLMVPALATTAIFTFIWTWNDFYTQLIYLTDPDKYTTPLALRAFVDQQSATDWGSVFAMSVVSLVPVFLVFLAGQRFLLRGIATTGGK